MPRANEWTPDKLADLLPRKPFTKQDLEGLPAPK